MSEPIKEAVEIDRRHWIYRHRLPVRITHWINVLCLTILLMSGLQIFNAHPALYWGNHSDFGNGFIEMKAADDDESKGITRIAGHTFNTTGFLGVSRGADGQAEERGFPRWLTIPSEPGLAVARRWHFFFAWLLVINGLAYLLYGAISRHFSRDLAPTKRDWRHIGRSIVDHALLRFPKGEEAKRYNVLQKLTYLAVIFFLLPLLILAGLTMSPGLDAAFPLVSLFGGRQTARTLHFLAAFGLVAFVFIHVLMVILSGPWNNLRSMISGRYDIESSNKIREPSHAS
jgi:thiosulfate reductase cytochrome b subunit